MADYWHKAWACPYFVWDDKQKIGCEGRTVIRFPSKDSLCEYANKYCTSIDGYSDCPVAKALEKKYGGRE